ncbi:MAG: hypothetical protein AAF639_26920 [Chloroflexota bacterium]
MSLAVQAPISAPVEEQATLMSLHQFLEKEKTSGPFQLVTGNGHVAMIPKSVFTILGLVTQPMVDGDAVHVTAVQQKLTIQQAADMLDESYDDVVQLIEEGTILSISTSTEPMLDREEVMTYKHQRDQKREKVLTRLTQLSQEYAGFYE